MEIGMHQFAGLAALVAALARITVCAVGAEHIGNCGKCKIQRPVTVSLGKENGVRNPVGINHLPQIRDNVAMS
jgi:hypothetical protein